jgi:hypothetical protein
MINEGQNIRICDRVERLLPVLVILSVLLGGTFITSPEPHAQLVPNFNQSNEHNYTRKILGEAKPRIATVEDLEAVKKTQRKIFLQMLSAELERERRIAKELNVKHRSLDTIQIQQPTPRGYDTKRWLNDIRKYDGGIKYLQGKIARLKNKYKNDASRTRDLKELDSGLQDLLADFARFSDGYSKDSESQSKALNRSYSILRDKIRSM